MFKRLLSVIVFEAMLVLPVVAFAVEDAPEALVITEESTCDYETLGVPEGTDISDVSVDIEAVWTPNIYTCPAGQYLRKTATVVDCAACPTDSYCQGFDDHTYNDSEYGRNSCEEGFYTDSSANTTRHDCRATEEIVCAEVNPHNDPHAISASYGEEGTLTSVNCLLHEDTVAADRAACVASCVITGLTCESDDYEAKEVDGVLQCVERKKESCPAGTYMPEGGNKCEECPADSYCNATVGKQACEPGLKSPKGSSSEADCGKVLHIGDDPNDVVYMHADKRGPSLVVQDSSDPSKRWYADATLVVGEEGAKTISKDSNKELHIKIGDKEYTVHTSYANEKD